MVEKKTRSVDTKGVHLLVYANYNGKRAEFAEVQRKVTEIVGEKFESVWILTGTRIRCPLPEGGLKACEGWFGLPKLRQGGVVE